MAVTWYYLVCDDCMEPCQTDGESIGMLQKDARLHNYSDKKAQYTLTIEVDYNGDNLWILHMFSAAVVTAGGQRSFVVATG